VRRTVSAKDLALASRTRRNERDEVARATLSAVKTATGASRLMPYSPEIHPRLGCRQRSARHDDRDSRSDRRNGAGQLPEYEAVCASGAR